MYLETICISCKPLYLLHSAEVAEAMHTNTFTPCMKKAVLTISNIVKTDEGMYRCVVSNAAGPVTSDTVELTVCKSKIARNYIFVDKYEFASHNCFILYVLPVADPGGFPRFPRKPPFESPFFWQCRGSRVTGAPHPLGD